MPSAPCECVPIAQAENEPEKLNGAKVLIDAVSRGHARPAGATMPSELAQG